MMMIISTLSLFLLCCASVNTKLTIKDIYQQFGDEECIEGEIELQNGKIIHFINGQSAQRTKNPKKNAEDKIVGTFFPDKPNKSPVTVLSEMAKIDKLADPYYHLENKEGPDHQPTFTVLLLIGEREFRGQGGSIKKAKNEAAQAALDSGVISANAMEKNTKSPGKIQEEQTPMSQLNNIALKLKMKVEYIREKYQRDAEIYGGSNKGFVNLGKKKSYEERLNASIYKTAKRGPDPDGDDSKGPFTYLVKVGEKLEFRANGRTKQGAKQNAAERAVDAFKEMKLQDAIDCLKEGTECNAANVKSPISILQEMAQYHRFPITYPVVSETGLPHKKTFQIRCEVFEGEAKISTDGEGSSKKEAKRIAAMQMVDKLSSAVITDGSTKMDGYIVTPKKKKSKKKSINRSDLLLLKEDITNKITSVYDYFITEDEKKTQKNQENSKRADDSKDKLTTDEDFESFDDSMDYKQRLHSILDDYGMNANYVELKEGYRQVAILIVPTHSKLICIAEAVDIPSAKELVSYHAIKFILNNSDFQFKNMYQESDIPGFEETGNVFIYSDINEKTD